MAPLNCTNGNSKETIFLIKISLKEICEFSQEKTVVGSTLKNKFTNQK